MISFELSTDVLGNTRFAFSPLSEVTLSLALIGSPQPTHAHATWLNWARQQVDGVDLELLLAVVPQGRWLADCLMATAASERTIEQQLATLTRTSREDLATDLHEVWAESGVPRRGRQLIEAGPRGPGMLAEAIWDYWDAVISPHWSRMCGVLDHDVSHRVSTLLSGGLFALLNDIHPDVSLEGLLLRIDKPHHASATYRAVSMTLVPSIFAWPNVILSDGLSDTFGLTYPARGVGLVWEGLDDMHQTNDIDPLGRLLGRTRAAVLSLTAVPMSTTRIARELGQSLPSVSQHLAVLRDAGLVTSRRSGKSVLYCQSPLAASIVAAQQKGHRTTGDID